MWEDMTDRATDLPPPRRRKLAYKVALSSQEFVSGGNRKTRQPTANDNEAAQWLAKKREREAVALEARTRKLAVDLRAWNEYIDSNDVPPDKDAKGP